MEKGGIKARVTKALSTFVTYFAYSFLFLLGYNLATDGVARPLNVLGQFYIQVPSFPGWVHVSLAMFCLVLSIVRRGSQYNRWHTV